MKRIVILYFLILASISVRGQTYVTQLNDSTCRLRFFDKNRTKVEELNIATLTWRYSTIDKNNIVITDGLNTMTVKNDGRLLSPVYANVPNFLNLLLSTCGSSPSPLPIPLIVNNVGIDTVRVTDSVRVWFNQGLDTSNQGILKSIFGILSDSLDKNIFINNDSLRVYFNNPPQISDTANQSVLLSIHNLLKDSLDKNVYLNNDSLRVYFKDLPFISDTANRSVLNAILQTLVDSLDKQLYILNPYIDSAIVRRMDSILVKLTPTNKIDTLKGLVFTAIAKVRTDIDTLFNCKSLSFGRKSNASGTLVLTYENGESESFDVTNDNLPTWVNGEFISQITYNATGAVGLIVNTLGCSQTPGSICAKVKPIFDCDLVIPITCNGWQSASGVWQTASGCWNTGQ